MLRMDKSVELELDGKTYKLPIVEGTEKERAIDISSLREQTGYITLDDGYGNTGSCQSQITFIDGEQGHFALSRHSHRGTGREIHFHRGGASAHHGASCRPARSCGNFPIC